MNFNADALENQLLNCIMSVETLKRTDDCII